MIKIENQMMFYEENDAVIGYVTFPFVKDKVVDINKTFTHSNHRGKGIAKQLLDALYEYLKEHNLRAKTSCSYAVEYFKKYPEKQDVLDI